MCLDSIAQACLRYRMLPWDKPRAWAVIGGVPLLHCSVGPAGRTVRALGLLVLRSRIWQPCARPGAAFLLLAA